MPQRRASVDQYIRSLIQGDELDPIDDALEDKLLRGLDSGPSRSLAPELLEDIKRAARRQ